MNEIEKFRLEIKDSKTFCFYPYVELSTNPAGHIKPCCNYIGVMQHPDEKIVSIFNGDIFDTAWNSQPMIDLRKNLHQGNIPKECSTCIRDGNAGMRHRSIHEYKNHQATLEKVYNTIQNDYKADHSPTYLELKPSNLCNLKCVMCNSYDSSQIAKELKELSTKFGGIKVHNGRFIEISTTPGITENNAAWAGVDQPEWSDNEEIWKNFERMAPHLETLSFAGGEPTIMPFVIRALNYCVEKDYAKNITVFISSNFTNLNKQFFELMPKYKKFELIASIDGFDKVNDYARFPSKWSQVSKNYLTAKEYMKYPNVKILTNITVSILNIVNLVDLLNWLEDRAKEYPYFKEWPFNINLIMYPREQQISILPGDLKASAKTKLNEYLHSSQILKDFPGLDSKIHLLLNELDKPDTNLQLLEVFKDRIKILDEHREIDITDYIPDIKELFK